MPLYSDYYYGGSQPPPYYLPSSAYSPATSRISSPYSFSYMSPISMLSAGIGSNPVPRGLRSYSPMLSSISETSSPLLPRRDVDHRSSPRRLAGKTFYRHPRPTVIDTEHLDLSRRKKDSEDDESTPGTISRTKSIVRMHTRKLKENPNLKKKKTQAELLMEKYLIKEKPIKEKESPTKKRSWEEKEDLTPVRRGTIRRRDSLTRVSHLQVPLVVSDTSVESPVEIEPSPSRKMSVDSELLKEEAAIFDCLIQEELGPNNKKELVLEHDNVESNSGTSENVTKTKTKRDSVPYVRKKSSSKLLDEAGIPILEKKKSRLKKKSSEKLVLDDIKSSESPSDSDIKTELTCKPMKRRSTKRKKHGGALKFKIDSLHVEEKSSPKLLHKFNYEVIVEEGNINDKNSLNVSPEESVRNKSDSVQKDIPFQDDNKESDISERVDINKTNKQEAKCDPRINEGDSVENVVTLQTEKYKNKFPLRGKLLQRQFSVESDVESTVKFPVINKNLKPKTECKQNENEPEKIIYTGRLDKEIVNVVKNESISSPGSGSIHSDSLNLELDKDTIGSKGDFTNDIHTQSNASVICDSNKCYSPDLNNFAQSLPCDKSPLPSNSKPSTPVLSSREVTPADDSNRSQNIEKCESDTKNCIFDKFRDKALPFHSRSNTPDISSGKNKSPVNENIQGKFNDRPLSHTRSNTPDLKSPKNQSFDNSSSKSSVSESGVLTDAKGLIKGKVSNEALPLHSRSNTPDLGSPMKKLFKVPKESPKNSPLPDQKHFPGKLRDKILPPHSRSNTPDSSSPKNKSFDSNSSKSLTPERSNEIKTNPAVADKLGMQILPAHSRSIMPDIINSADKFSNSNSVEFSGTPSSNTEQNSKSPLNDKRQDKVLPLQNRSKTPDLNKTTVQNKASKSDPNTPTPIRKTFAESNDFKSKIGVKELNKKSNPDLIIEKSKKSEGKDNNTKDLRQSVHTNEPSDENVHQNSRSMVKSSEINQQSGVTDVKKELTSSVPTEMDIQVKNTVLVRKPPESKKMIGKQPTAACETSQAINKDCIKIESSSNSEVLSDNKMAIDNVKGKPKLKNNLNLNSKSITHSDQGPLKENQIVLGINETQNKTKTEDAKIVPLVNRSDLEPEMNLVSKVELKKNGVEYKILSKLVKSEELKIEQKVDLSTSAHKPTSEPKEKSSNEKFSSNKALSGDSSKMFPSKNDPNKMKVSKEAKLAVDKGDSNADAKEPIQKVQESLLPGRKTEEKEKKGNKVDKISSKKKIRPKSESDMVDEELDKNEESKAKASSVEEKNKTKKSKSLPKSESEQSSKKSKKSKEKKNNSKSPKKHKRITSDTNTPKENNIQPEGNSDGDKTSEENSSELSKRSTHLMHFINKCMKLSEDNENLSIEISDDEEEEESSESTSDSSEYTDDSSSEEESSDDQKECDVNCHRKCEKLMPNLCGVNQKLIVEALSSVRKGSTESRDRGSPSRRRHSDAALALDDERGEGGRPAGVGRVTPPATTIPKFRKYTMDDFQFLKVLGKGSFGKVLLAELRGTQYYYAVKCLKKDVVLEDDDVECTLIERKVLALGTNHPYLCHLFCTFQTESHLFFVMEYLNGGDLMFHIQQQGRFDEGRARFYAAEITTGLKFLHKKGIVYRDLKLDNILLDFDGHVRIADFGMCKLQIYLDRTADTFCGTPDYMAPEIIKGLKYNQCVDWWSFGILLYEMLVGQSPFSGCDEDDLFWCICNRQPHYPRYISLEAKRILMNLLEKESSKRLGSCENGAAEVMGHPFFDGLDWERLERRELVPPFKPNVKHPLDVHYFDKHFTAERARLTPIDPSILQSMDQTQFQGFSYTNPNVTD